MRLDLVLGAIRKMLKPPSFAEHPNGTAAGKVPVKDTPPRADFTDRLLLGKILFWLGTALAGIPAFLILISANGLILLLGAIHRNPFKLVLILITLGVGLLLAGLWELSKKEPERLRNRIIISALVILAAFWFLGQYYVFPTHSQDSITFQNGDVTVSGTLLIPTKGERPYPAVILISGCCNMFTDESRWGNYTTAQLLLQNGIAALIYDKRGFGDSTGSPSSETGFEELSDDVLAVINQLTVHEDVDPNKLGLLGISHGGWVAPLVASKTDNVAFLILVSGGAVPTSTEFESELRLALEEANFSRQEIERVWPEIIQLRLQINEYYKTGERLREVVFALEAVQNEGWFLAANEAGVFPGPEGICAYGSRCAESHIANWDFDPVPLIKNFDKPVIFFFGTNDTVVPAIESIERVNAEILSDSAQDVELVSIPRTGHSMLESWSLIAPICYCRSMSPETNSFLELATGFIPRFVPEYRNRLVSWTLDNIEEE